MKPEPPDPRSALPLTPSWQVLKALARAYRARTVGRAVRMQQLRRMKRGHGLDPASSLGVLLAMLMALAVHVLLGMTLIEAWNEATVLTQMEAGRVPLSNQRVLDALKAYDQEVRRHPRPMGGARDAPTSALLETQWDRFVTVARWSKPKGFESDPAWETTLRRTYSEHGVDGFALREEMLANGRMEFSSPLKGLIVLLIVGWWAVMLVLQGEGLDLDTQRQEHPAWEWLLGHPVRPAAALAGELLGPFFANPLFWLAPVFWMVAFVGFYDWEVALPLGLLVGVPLALMLSAMGRGLVFFILLRFRRRSRGAWVGLMSAVGFGMMIACFFLRQFHTQLPAWMACWSVNQWPWGGWLAWGQALLTGWSGGPAARAVEVAALLLALVGLLGVAVVGLVRRGLEGGLEGAADEAGPTTVNPAMPHRALGGKNALIRKELLWMKRDRSAVVQVFLVPLLFAGLQAVNLGRSAALYSGKWQVLAGLVLIVGTYFLLVLGPRALASEGKSLWMALTWPQDLTGLLAAKAEWWAWISCVPVWLGLVGVAWMHPNATLPLLLVGALWWVHARSLSFKSVTMVTAPSSTGEMSPPTAGSQWLAVIGSFAVASGLMMGLWHVMVVGLVLTGALALALWEAFAHRLPYLFDPWSEKLPPAPTVLHGLVAVVASYEVLSVMMGATTFLGGVRWMPLLYAAVMVVAGLALRGFLLGRGVPKGAVWRMGEGQRAPEAWALAPLLGGLMGGVGLAYCWGLERWFSMSDFSWTLSDSADWTEIGVMAIFMAPVAEEYLFRGVVYQSLNRRWPGWRAMGGSAVLFACLHPPMSWPMVLPLGWLLAWLFQRGGRLGPCMVLHAVYNAVLFLPAWTVGE